jgi:hypothetical protein
VEPACTEHGNGFDDDTKARAAAMLKWLCKECERRTSASLSTRTFTTRTHKRTQYC